MRAVVGFYVLAVGADLVVWVWHRVTGRTPEHVWPWYVSAALTGVSPFFWQAVAPGTQGAFDLFWMWLLSLVVIGMVVGAIGVIRENK